MLFELLYELCEGFGRCSCCQLLDQGKAGV
jgi:hypothetical protein